MNTPIVQRYLVACKLDSPFNTEFLIFPAWDGSGGDVVCIIDMKTGCYCRQSEWPDESLKPVWIELEEDTL